MNYAIDRLNFVYSKIYTYAIITPKYMVTLLNAVMHDSIYSTCFEHQPNRKWAVSGYIDNTVADCNIVIYSPAIIGAPLYSKLLREIFVTLIHEWKHCEQQDWPYHNDHLTDPAEIDAYATSIAYELLAIYGAERTKDALQKQRYNISYDLQKYMSAENISNTVKYTLLKKICKIVITEKQHNTAIFM